MVTFCNEHLYAWVEIILKVSEVTEISCKKILWSVDTRENDFPSVKYVTECFSG